MKIIINNIATEYSDIGGGDIILFLHGWLDNMHTFDSLIKELQGYRIIGVDLPGFGKSETPSSVWELDDYVDFVASFIGKLKINPKTIIGHSFGGRIIIKGVSSNKLTPSKIVLIAAAGIAKSSTLGNHIIRIIAKIGKVATFIPPFTIYRNRLKERLYQKTKSDFLASEALQPIFLKVIAEDLSLIAYKINVPTLLIWGEYDKDTPVSDAKIFANNIRNSHLNIISSSSHFVHQEQPVVVGKLIKDFLL